MTLLVSCCFLSMTLLDYFLSIAINFACNNDYGNIGRFFSTGLSRLVNHDDSTFIFQNLSVAFIFLVFMFVHRYRYNEAER